MICTFFEIIIILIIAVSLLFFFASFCFEDTGPDMDWHDNYAVIQCPHHGEKTDVVVNSCVTCETVHTICDDCGEVLNTKTDCS